MHFDCENGFLNSIKEIIWQTEAKYRCPLSLRIVLLVACRELVHQIWWSCFMVHLFLMCFTIF